MSIFKKVVLSANTAWYLANFRLRLARSLQARGYSVLAVAPWGEDAARLEQAGVRFIPLFMDNAGTNPIRDFGLVLRLVRLLRLERPDVFIGYTVKPNVYGGIVCRLLGVPSVHNVAGLGTVFMKANLITRLVRTLYRMGFKRAAKVFFQNPDDFALFREYGLVEPGCAAQLPGSGVDTNHFLPPVAPRENTNQPFRFLLTARLLWDKGVGEFVQAARQLKSEGANVECQLLGFLGVQNRTAITRGQIEAWEEEGIVDYLGSAEDVRPVLGTADCVVLPSYYREGTPRSLLEAASMAIPIITTDAVGCRETVDDGLTGYLCEPRDAKNLADCMRTILNLPLDERVSMGKRGRERMVAQFDEQIVLDQYIAVVENVTGPACTN